MAFLDLARYRGLSQHPHQCRLHVPGDLQPRHGCPVQSARCGRWLRRMERLMELGNNRGAGKQRAQCGEYRSAQLATRQDDQPSGIGHWHSHQGRFTAVQSAAQRSWTASSQANRSGGTVLMSVVNTSTLLADPESRRFSRCMSRTTTSYDLDAASLLERSQS